MSQKPQKRHRTGEIDVIRLGHEPLGFNDLYVNLLSMSWGALLLMVSLLYIVVNVFFAAIYFETISGISGASTFADAFFFSVQTMATIGYGHMIPTSVTTNSLSTLEALCGFIYIAFVTGLIFAKFSRPTAHVLFSKVAVISDFEGKPYLKIRLANKRDNRIVDVDAKMFLLRHTVTKEGFAMRRFIDLKLVRNHMPLLRLTWTLLHPIDEDSPLYGMSDQDMIKMGDEIFVTLIGLDETLAQTIHARYSYFADEIVHGAFFEDIVRRDGNTIEVNYGRFHDTRDLPPEGVKRADVPAKPYGGMA